MKNIISYTKLYTLVSDKNTINEEISTDLLQIVYRSQGNKLPINLDKTTYKLITARKRLNDTDNLKLNVGETNIKQVSKQKLLVIVIDENLSWTPHSD